MQKEAKPGAPQSVQSETQQQLQILDLIKKQRSPEDDRKVHDIIASQLRLEEKIQEIRKIDQPDSPAPAAAKEKSDATPPPTLELIRIDNREYIRHNLRMMQKNMSRNKLIRYVLYDFWRLKNYGKKLNLFTAMLFPPKVLLNRSIAEGVLIIQEETSKILPLVYFASEVGWLHLGKYEYNLLTKLKEFCETIMKIDAIPVKKHIPPDRFNDLRKALIACNYDEAYPTMIVNSLTAVLNQYVKTKPRSEITGNIAFALMVESAGSSCPYTLVVAAAMAQYRRFIKFRELINPVDGGVISDYDFDCDEKTRSKIDAHIYIVTKKIESLLEERKKVERINFFVNQFVPAINADRGSYDFHLFVEFYEAGAGVEKFQFIRDNDEIAIFVINYFKRFFSEFEKLLSDAVELESEGMVRLFSFEIANTELTHINNVLHALNKKLFSCPSLSRKRFMLLRDKKQPEVASPEESFILHIVDELNRVMVAFGEKIGGICLSHSKEPTPGEEHRILKLIDPSVFIGKRFELYYWDRMILSPGYMRGKKLGRILNTIASLCFLFPLYFLDQKLFSFIEKEHEIQDKLKSAKEELEHVTNPAAFMGIKNKYHLK
jgi:hypothetical protein